MRSNALLALSVLTLSACDHDALVATCAVEPYIRSVRGDLSLVKNEVEDVLLVSVCHPEDSVTWSTTNVRVLEVVPTSRNSARVLALDTGIATLQAANTSLPPFAATRRFEIRGEAGFAHLRRPIPD